LNFPTAGLADENFKQLAELDKRYRDQGLVILGFPSNQFSGKETAMQEEIVSFIKRKYNVDFEIYQKVDVNGPNTDILFDYLKRTLTGTITNDLKWHFTKFLIDRNGNPVKRFAPNDAPFSFEEDIRHRLRQESAIQKAMECQQQEAEKSSSSSKKEQPIGLQYQQGKKEMGMEKEREMGMGKKEMSLEKERDRDRDREREMGMGMKEMSLEKEREKGMGVKEKQGLHLESESKKKEMPGEKHEKTEYRGNIGQTEFSLKSEKHKEDTREMKMEKDQPKMEEKEWRLKMEKESKDQPKMEEKEWKLKMEKERMEKDQPKMEEKEWRLKMEKESKDQPKMDEKELRLKMEKEEKMQMDKKEEEEKSGEKVEDQGQKGKLGEGGLFGVQFGIHVGQHHIQTGIQAGKEPVAAKPQEQKEISKSQEQLK